MQDKCDTCGAPQNTGHKCRYCGDKYKNPINDPEERLRKLFPATTSPLSNIQSEHLGEMIDEQVTEIEYTCRPGGSYTVGGTVADIGGTVADIVRRIARSFFDYEDSRSK